MKTIQIILIIFMVISNNLFSQNLIKGHIEGLKNDTIYISINSLNIKTTYDDTVLASSGEFEFIKRINSPTMITIKPKSGYETHGIVMGMEYLPSSKSISCYIEPSDTITIDAELTDDMILYDIQSQHKINHEISEFHNQNIQSSVEKLKMEREMGKLFLSDTEKFLELRQEYGNKELSGIIKRTEFIKDNLDKDLSAYYLIGSCDANLMNEYYDKLDFNVRNGIFKDMLEDRLILAKQRLGLLKKDEISKNIPAPDFMLTTLNGDLVNPSNYRGKYMVLDFWGTWCAPCLNGIPQMKEYYENYSSKIEFIGIACRDYKPNVEKVVNDYKLEWIQVLDNSSNDLAKIYKVTSWPTKILIDDKGYVVDVFIGESEEFYNRIDELFKN